MKGYSGKILRVNLGIRQVSTEEPSEEFFKIYLGGRGFIVHTLLKEVPRGAEALGPDRAGGVGTVI